MATEAPKTSGGKRTVTGGCHCGAVRYEAVVDFTDLKPCKCNCSYCHKSNYVTIRLDPEDPTALRLLSPASESAQGNYLFGSKCMNHYFCQACGVPTMMRGEYEYDAGDGHRKKEKSLVINAVTLDQGQEGLDLTQRKFGYWNGKDDAWMTGLRDAPAPWGTW